MVQQKKEKAFKNLLTETINFLHFLHIKAPQKIYELAKLYLNMNECEGEVYFMLKHNISKQELFDINYEYQNIAKEWDIAQQNLNPHRNQPSLSKDQKPH